MNDSSLYVSNGTCFYGPGQKADSNFIPCGNAALMGPQSCCYAGDYCLSSTACWDNNTVVTYVAGCTDSTFSSAKCTNKFDYPDQQYVAMARCEGDDVDIWSGCYKHPDWVAIQKEPDCACNASKPLIRNSNGKSTLDEIGRLPSTAGGTISFNPTAIPTLALTSARTSASTPLPTSSPTTSPIAAIGTSQGLSSGAKVGVGVGVGIGVPLLSALIFIAFTLRRKKSRDTASASAPGPAPQHETSQQDQSCAAAEQPMQEKPSSPEKDLATTPDPSEQGPAWYGYKPELAANSTFKSELSGDDPMSLGTSSWNSGTLESHQVSEMSSHDAITSAK